MISELRGAIRGWRFWMFDAWLEEALRHRQSVLGFVWMLLPTVIFVALIGSIFRHVSEGGVNFYLYLLVGLVIWSPVNLVLSSSGRCYNANKSFVLVGGLPLLSFNFKILFKALLNFLTQSVLIVAGIGIFRPSLSIELLFVIPAVLLLALLLMPMSIGIALVGARSEDFAEAMKSIQRILFLATPIIWSATANPGRLAAIEPFLIINPFYFAVELIRAPLVGQPIDHSKWLPLVLFTIAAWGVAWIFHRIMARDTAQWL